MFSGDTLFPGGVGNTTFEDGDFPTIIESIDDRLFTLPAETLVLPGHGLDTTIGTERRTSTSGSSAAGSSRATRRRSPDGAPGGDFGRRDPGYFGPDAIHRWCVNP